MLLKTASGNQELGASSSTLPKDFAGENSCADTHISTDGRFLYASNRGHDSIVIYEVDSTNGGLSLFGHESTRGKTPRNFSLSPDENFLLVANQKTNTLVSFKRNSQNGTLKYVDKIDAPTPVCILF